MSLMMAALHDGIDTMQVTEVPIPEVGPKDVLVRVRNTGICGSDLLWYKVNQTPETIPGGHEVAGEIIKVGEMVDCDRVGERVAVEAIGHGLACGSCWYCRIGQFVQCQGKMENPGGGFAEYIVRRDYGCYVVPGQVSWTEAALIEPLAVSIHGIRRGRMRGGETVAVLGAGNIGMTSVAAARALGAGNILVSARYRHQADMALRLGADCVLTSEDSFRATLLDMTDGRGADITIETAGGNSGATLRQAIDVTRLQGRIVILGGFRADITSDWIEPLLKEQSIIFSSCYSVMDGRHDFEVAVDLMACGRVELNQIVTDRFVLDEIQDAFLKAHDKATGSIKIQIQFSDI